MKALRASGAGWRALALLVLIVALLPVVAGSSYVMRIAALVWIMGLAAVGLHILMGMAGQISLGHAGFFGIGAYASAVLPARYGVPVVVAAAGGIVLAGLIAYLVGKPILRLKGHYLAIATLGFSLLIGLVITSEVALTGGPDGMDVKRLGIAGFTLESPSTWYWISAALMVAGVAVAMVLRDSPTGRALRAILDSEVAAASMGVDVARRKLQAFVIASVYAAVAGSTLALMNGFITPDLAGFMTSVEFVAMVVIGGAATPFGALVGAALLTLLPQLLASFHDYQDIAVGLIIMLSMIFLRQGIVPTLGQLLRRGIK
ncbi:amino acid/amide ABC transporter membrane protein 2, HAAT family [Variovorax sp. PDC80]|uniref:branched-chain amino acid ABC transporter permease n=1 Tax=Variovorax sp. PDC80 TaxID=1882827 RepID=UPI0008E8547D|nr:branched-chain amino acid ABC transporter permease [Variovorax sp. PDC80]SFO77717.1 amino acid/amide ABC transporter membrane protein 2, HAAT family [Variovorax sp. PDC80]